MVIVASDLLHLPTIEALKEHSIRAAMMNSSVRISMVSNLSRQSGKNQGLDPGHRST